MRVKQSNFLDGIGNQGTMGSSRSGYRDGGNRKRSAAAFLRSIPGERSSEELAELRASAETAWDLIPGVRATMFPHQREGFEFVWGHIAGGIGRECFGADVDGGGGSGCIVSHAPGTGKSRLAIAVIQAFLRLRPTTARPVIVAPRGVLLTWEEEFRKWRFHAPFHNLNSEAMTGREDKDTVAVFAGSGGGGGTGRRCSREVTQMAKLMSWRKGGGVLGVSYQMLEKLAGDSAEEQDREEFRRVLLDSPGLVVLDEGHIPRNEGSQIWQVKSGLKIINLFFFFFYYFE